MLEVRVLGGLSAAVDGRPVELPADARARELLARLALSPGPHPRSALAGRLRPDVPEDSARKTLRNALYELRRALGPAGRDALVVTGQRVGLADSVRVDVLEFRRRVADGELEAAADAGNGELLAGFEGDWALRARDEHAVELAGVLAALATRAEDAGDLPAAIAWTRRRLDVEPLAEAAHRELIRLLALDGDRPAALTAARAMSERLRTELGIPPSAATRALVEDVRRGRIARPAEAGAPALPAALAAAERPEGREPALARLERAWADATSGPLRFALVTGEPGIGKTTLAAELARRVHAGGGAVLLGRCDEHALVPFQPWIEALEGLLDALPPADADHWLTAHDGALTRLLPARGAAHAPPEGPRERYLAFELVRALLEDVAARPAGPARARRRALGRRGLARPAAPRRAVRARGADARAAVRTGDRARAGRRPGARRAPAGRAARLRRPRRPRRRRGGRAPRPAHGTRSTTAPRAATASAAAATRSSSRSWCARRRSPAATSTASPQACAT